MCTRDKRVHDNILNLTISLTINAITSVIIRRCEEEIGNE